MFELKKIWSYKKNLSNLLMIMIWLHVVNIALIAQIDLPEYQLDSLQIMPKKDYIEYGLDKVTNTYVFTLRANYQSVNDFGTISIAQNYRGLGLHQESNSFRDDETFVFDYAYPFLSGLYAVAQTNWFYSSDTRTSGNNELNRLNGIGGLRYLFAEGSNFEFLAGYEENKQLSVSSPGLFMSASGDLINYQFTNHILNASINGEYLKLNLDRTNTDLDFLAGLSGLYADESKMDFYFNYKLQNRDLLSTNLYADETIPIENRFENRLVPRINLGIKLTDNLNASFSLNLTNMVIDKSFKAPIEELAVSKMRREFHEFQLGILTDIYYYSDGLSLSGGFVYTTRTEENLVFKKYEISDIEANEIKQLESQRDNISGRSRLYFRGTYSPSNNDTIDLHISSALYRYDTPSEKNYDDRDELSYVLSTSYMRRIDKNLAVGVSAETQMLHLVFLNSQRSSMNNWNRILRLGPEIKWTNDYFYINPRFEVLANYTAYDFDNLNDNISSYSFRQIGYRDSICVNLGRSVSLQSRINVRYFERGILYWDNFSESPQNSNMEYFIKILLFTKLSNEVVMAAGIRAYSLEQKTIKSNNVTTSSYSHFSWGPESVISVKFYDNSTISLQGWYEFQYINNSSSNKIPNIFLMTNLSI